MENLTLEPLTCQLNGITLYETVDVNALNKLIHSSLLKPTLSKWKEFNYTSEKQQLTKYYNLIKNGIAEIQYNKCNDTIWGRCNPKDMVSLFTIRKEIRHTICSKYYIDIDIVNCHPTILYQICKQHNIDCFYLEKYVTNRSYYLNKVQTHYNVSYDDAKLLFIIILYCGGFKRWADEVNTTLPALDFIEDFIKEFRNIAEIITNKNSLIRQSVIERKEKQCKNNYYLPGTTISIFLQELEVRILETIYNYLVEHNYILKNNIVLCADGVMIDVKTFKPELLDILPTIIKEKFGFQLEFTTKIMDKGFTNNSIDESITFDLHNQEFTTGMLSDYFKILYDKFIYYDTKIYMYNGIYWEEDSQRINIYNFIDNTFFNNLLNYYCKKREILIKNERCETSIDKNKSEEYKKQLDLLEKFHKNISLLRQIKYKKTLTEDICNKLYNNSISFNTNPNLFAFNNAIFDLSIGNIIEPNKYDYISVTCGYNYEYNYNNSKLLEYNNLLDTIFPNKDNKEYYLSALSTGLTGYQIENLFIATGQGGNGKGVINTQMLKTCGNYGYKLSSSVLLSEIKSGANPEIASLNNKRFALTTEPTDRRKICSSTLKELTGDKTINARFAYSNSCNIILRLSLFMECNSLPKLDEVNDAIERRIRAIPFVSSFKSEDDFNKTVDKTNVYIGNPRYKSDEFVEENKLTLFHILVPYCKQFIQSGLKLPKIPEQCKSVAIDYLTKSDNIYEWVCEKYETGCETDFIYIKDIYNLFKNSEYYENLNKSDKREYSLKNFTEKIKNNLFLKENFKDRGCYIGKLRITQSVLIKFKEFVNNE